MIHTLLKYSLEHLLLFPIIIASAFQQTFNQFGGCIGNAIDLDREGDNRTLLQP